MLSFFVYLLIVSPPFIPVSFITYLWDLLSCYAVVVVEAEVLRSYILLQYASVMLYGTYQFRSLCNLSIPVLFLCTRVHATSWTHPPPNTTHVPPFRLAETDPGCTILSVQNARAPLL